MKRDMDLVRRILFDVETSDRAVGRDHLELDYDEWNSEQVSYHIMLMHEAGLIVGKELDTLDDGAQRFSLRLTGAGHEFLDLGRDDSRWKKATRTVVEKAGGLAFRILESLLTRLASDSVLGAGG